MLSWARPPVDARVPTGLWLFALMTTFSLGLGSGTSGLGLSRGFPSVAACGSRSGFPDFIYGLSVVDDRL